MVRTQISLSQEEYDAAKKEAARSELACGAIAAFVADITGQRLGQAVDAFFRNGLDGGCSIKQNIDEIVYGHKCL